MKRVLTLTLFILIVSCYSTAQTPPTISSIYYIIKNVEPYLPYTKFSIYSSTPHGQRFTQGNIICSYDTTIYGSYIVNNGKFTAYLSTDLDHSVYALTVSDIGPDRIQATIISTTGTRTNYDSLTPVPSEILTCQLNGIPINANINSAAFSFDRASMQQGSSYINVNSNLQQVFDSVYAVSSLAPVVETGVLNYSLTNFDIDPVNQQIAFDINADDGAGGLFADGFVFIDYDPTAFGTSSLAGLSTITPVSHYSESIGNYGDHTLRVQFKADGHPLTALPATLAHLVIPYTQLTPDLLIADSAVTAGFPNYYYDTTAMSVVQYPGVSANGSYNSPRSLNDSITFGILNPIVDSTKTYLDFDIVGFAQIYTGPLASYRVTLAYNSLAFDYMEIINTLGYGDDGAGDSVYDFSYNYGNSILTVNLNDNSYYDPTLNSVSDFVFDSTIIAHVRMHITDCGELPGISVDASNSAADWADSTSYTPYTPVLAGGGYNNGGHPMCVPLPKVNNWTPICTNAGSFEVVTIYGRHFGIDTGTVYFTNANNPSTYVHTLPQDIRHWDDNEIQLLIPSQPEDNQIAASGNFYIKTATGLDDIADNERISIGYANYNKRGGDNYARFVYHTDSFFVFHLDSALYNNTAAYSTLIALADDIYCRTGFFIEFASAPASINSPMINDGIHLISLNPYSPSLFSDTNTLAVTNLFQRIQSCYTGLPDYNNWADYVLDADITVNATLPSNRTWNWNRSNNATTNTQYDFYTVMEHELGHFMLLCHTRPQSGSNILYPSIIPGQQNGNYGYDADAELGIQNALMLGRVLGATSNCIPGRLLQTCPTPIAINPCMTRLNTTNSINEINGNSTSFSASLSPNPYEANTVIHIEVSVYSHFTIGIYDIVGHLIRQVDTASGTPFDIPISGFNESAGIYLIQISDSSTQQVLKMVKL